MFIGARERNRCGLKPTEDQVSTGIRDVVQASKSDLVARSVTIDLLQMAKRVSRQYVAAEHEGLSGNKSLTLVRVVVND